MKLTCICAIMLVTIAVQIQPTPGGVIISLVRRAATKYANIILEKFHPFDLTKGGVHGALEELKVKLKKDFLDKYLPPEQKKRCIEKIHNFIEICKMKCDIKGIYSDSQKTMKRFMQTAHEMDMYKQFAKLKESIRSVLVKHSLKSLPWKVDD